MKHFNSFTMKMVKMNFISRKIPIKKKILIENTIFFVGYIYIYMRWVQVTSKPLDLSKSNCKKRHSLMVIF